MTEYELIDAFSSMVSAMQGSLTLYLSVVTAYLITAYLVAHKLTTLQVVIISILFLVFSFGFLAGSQNYFEEMIRLAQEVRIMGREDFGSFANINTKFFLLVVDLFGIVASLIFMYQTRKVGNS